MKSSGAQKSLHQRNPEVNRNHRRTCDEVQMKSLQQRQQSNESNQYRFQNQLKTIIHKALKSNMSELNQKFAVVMSKLSDLDQIRKLVAHMDTIMNERNQHYFQRDQRKQLLRQKDEQPTNNFQMLPFLKRSSNSMGGQLQPKITQQFFDKKFQQFLKGEFAKNQNEVKQLRLQILTLQQQLKKLEIKPRVVEQKQKQARYVDKGASQRQQLLKQQLIQLKNNQKLTKQSYLRQLNTMREKHKMEINNIIQKSQQRMSQLQIELKSHNQTHINQLSIIVSNQQNQYQSAFKFIEQQVEHFQNKKIAKIKLLFQMDDFNQNIGNYLIAKQGELFPFLILFYSKKSVLFGAYSTHLYRSTEDISKAKGFLFNATKQIAFMPDSRPNTLSSVTFQDNYLYFGNREVIIKNNSIKIVRVSCGAMFGVEYYSVQKRHHLTGQQIEQIQLDNVELHRVYFIK